MALLVRRLLSEAEQLGRLLAERGVEIERWHYHNPRKPRSIWVIGRKGWPAVQTAIAD